MRGLSEKKRTLSSAALALVALLLVLDGATPGFAAAPTQPGVLSASVTGGVSNLGRQTYAVSGGQVAFAEIAGQVIIPQDASIAYDLNVVQTGVSSLGEAS